MGNSAGKIDEGDEWEFTVRVKKRPLSAQREQEQVPEDQNGGPETVAEFDFDVKRNPKKPVVNPTPLNILSPGTGKKKARKALSLGVETQPTGEDLGATPRGRKSTCASTPLGNDAPVLVIRMIKSHLAPNWYMTLPADFVTKHILKDVKEESKTYNITNAGNCKTLQVTRVQPNRYSLSKKQWQDFAQEHKLEMEDSVRLEILNDTQVQVDIIRKEAEPAVPEPEKKPETDFLDPTAEEAEEDGPVAVPLVTVTPESLSTVNQVQAAEESRQ